MPGLLQRVLAGEPVPQAAAGAGKPPGITGILSAGDGKNHGIANVITKGSAAAVRIFQDSMLTYRFIPADHGQIAMSSVRKKIDAGFSDSRFSELFFRRNLAQL